MQEPSTTDIAQVLKAPETARLAAERERFFSLGASARREALELLSIAEERRSYLARLGTTPTDAFRVLVAADFMLRNGSPDQKLAVILQLLLDYSIDLEELQEALESGDAPAHPVNRQ